MLRLRVVNKLEIRKHDKQLKHHVTDNTAQSLETPTVQLLYIWEFSRAYKEICSGLLLVFFIAFEIHLYWKWTFNSILQAYQWKGFVG